MRFNRRVESFFELSAAECEFAVLKNRRRPATKHRERIRARKGEIWQCRKHIFSKRIIYRHRYSIKSLIDDYSSLSGAFQGKHTAKSSSDFAQLPIINQNLIFHPYSVRCRGTQKREPLDRSSQSENGVQRQSKRHQSEKSTEKGEN